MGIKTKFFKVVQKIQSYSPVSSAGWLPDDNGGYLYTLNLSGFSDALDAAAIWSAQGGQTVDSSRRLYDALDAHRHILAKTHAADAARQEEDPRAFNHVVVWIPKKQWDNQARSGGHQLALMVNNLQANHAEHFKGQLLLDRPPAYCIMPHPDLKPDQVRCQFGLSVFVPSTQDTPLASLHLDCQASEHSPANWIFFESGKRITRPFGLYAAQQYLQFGGTAETSCPPLPNWFSSQAGYVQLCLVAESDVDEATPYGDGEYITNWQSSEGIDAARFDYQTVAQETLTLSIRLTAALAAQYQGNIRRGLTVIGGQPRRAQGQLWIQGLVLPKLPSHAPDMQQWTLCFDDQGQLLDSHTPSAALRLTATRQSGVQYQCHGQPPQPLNPPMALCGNFTCHAPVDSSMQYALLQLPFPLSVPWKGERCTLGRPDGDTRQANKPHISLNVLDQADNLRDSTGNPAKTNLNYLNFSGEHLELRFTAGQLRLVHRSSSANTYLLDAQGQLQHTLAPGNLKEHTLSPSAQLIAGGYWLRLE